MRVLSYTEYNHLMDRSVAKGNELATILSATPLPADLYEAAITQLNSCHEDIEFIDKLIDERGVDITVLAGSEEINDFYRQILGNIETPLQADTAAAVFQTDGDLYLFISVSKLAEFEKIERLSFYVHEFVHVDQYMAGRLAMDGSVVTWEGAPYITAECLSNLTLEEYLALPWEKEAYRAQRKLIDHGLMGE